MAEEATPNPTVEIEPASVQAETNFESIYVERTLAIIKPDAIAKADEIEDIILRSGFTVHQVIQIKLL